MPIRKKTPTITVSARAAKRLRGGHPWVYRSDLSEKSAAAIPAAALVHVADERGKVLGSALSSSASQIALRMVSENAIEDDGHQLPRLIAERIAKAVQYRAKFVKD